MLSDLDLSSAIPLFTVLSRADISADDLIQGGSKKKL